MTRLFKLPTTKTYKYFHHSLLLMLSQLLTPNEAKLMFKLIKQIIMCVCPVALPVASGGNS